MYTRFLKRSSFLGGGPEGVIFRSDDGGQSWKKLTGGLPAETGRIELDIWLSKPNIVYASIETENRGQDNFFPRAFELSLASSLDPYTRAKITMTTSYPIRTIEVFPDPADFSYPARALFFGPAASTDWVHLPGALVL